MQYLCRVIVRRATEEDIPWLMVQLRAFAATVPTRHSVMGSDLYCEALLGRLIKEQYVAIAMRDGEAVGLIAGLVQPSPFNPDLQLASELWWWVTPEERHGRAGLLLLDAYEDWVENESDAEMSNFTLETISPVSDRALTRRGYREFERQYIREIS